MISVKEHIRSIISIGVPLIIGQLGSTVQQFADTAMVSACGTLELSAAGFVGNLFNLVIFFLLGISYSTVPIVGAYFGRCDYIGTSRALRESVIVGLSVSTVVMAGLFLLYTNMEILGQPEEILPLARPYFLMLLLSLPFLAVFNSLKQFSDALGQTKQPMWVMLLANILNILLNWLLIFGVCYGERVIVPGYGLLGAGMATLAARIFMAAAMAFLVVRQERYRMARGDYAALHEMSEKGMLTDDVRRELANLEARELFHARWHGIWRMLCVGLPISIQMCLEAASFSICAIYMGWIGAKPIAAHQIMSTIATLCFLVMYGLGAAAAVRISQFCGRGEWYEVRRTTYVALGIGACCFVTTSTLICLSIDSLMSLFTTDEEVCAIVLSLLVPFVAYQVGDCLQIIFANALRGIARVRTMMLSAFIAYVVVSLPLSFFFAFVCDFGAAGVWFGMPFGLTVAGGLFGMEFHRHVRKALSMQKPNIPIKEVI